MIKKYLFTVVLAAAATAAVSCQKDSAVQEESSVDEAPFTACISTDDATRTSLHGYVVEWNPGDEICINGVTYTAKPYMRDRTWAGFYKKDSEAPIVYRPFKAFYPATLCQAATPTAGAMNVLPAEQKHGDFSLNPMYAETYDRVLEFKNICALLAIKVGPVEEEGRASAVNSIRVSSSNLDLSGPFTIEKTGTGYKAVVTPANLAPVTLKCDPSVTPSPDSTVFYVSVPAGEYRDLKIEVNKDGAVYTETMKFTSAPMEQNKIYTIPFVDGKLIEEIPLPSYTKREW